MTLWGYFRRGRHRATRFSIRVADLAAANTPVESSFWTDEGDGYFAWRGRIFVNGGQVPGFITFAPPSSTAPVNFPALVEASS